MSDTTTNTEIPPEMSSDEMTSEIDTLIAIEVVYGVPDKQKILAITMKEHSTVEQAIIESGMMALFDDIDLAKNKVGIWNRAARLTDKLEEGDRIEIYRPLLADPKEVRKRRAEKAKLEGRADKVTGGRVNKLRKKD